MHLYWKERVGSTIEDDLIIFPEEAEMKRVPECTTGRVYLLQFKSSNQKLFFWMQDKDESKDEERVAKLNRLINDPQSVVEEQQQNARSEMEEESESAADMLNLLSGGQGSLWWRNKWLFWWYLANTLFNRSWYKPRAIFAIPTDCGRFRVWYWWLYSMRGWLFVNILSSW